MLRSGSLSGIVDQKQPAETAMTHSVIRLMIFVMYYAKVPDQILSKMLLDRFFVAIISEANAALTPPAQINLVEIRQKVMRPRKGLFNFLARKEDRVSMFPQLSALIDTAVEKSEQERVITGKRRALQAMEGRLRARRRLSLGLAAASSSSAFVSPAVPLIVPSLPRLHHRALSSRRRRRRASSGLAPTSSAADIRSFVQRQEEEENKQLTSLPLVSPDIRQWARRRASVRAQLAAAATAAGQPLREEELQEAVAKEVPAWLNCRDFAENRCAEPQNTAGFHWCAVPEMYWWGPIGNGKNCYDIRELLLHFANQAIDIPSLPRPSHPFSYPDTKAPVKDNLVKSMMEVARTHNHPIPWELQVYFTGQELQRSLPVAMLGGRKKARSLRKAAPYSAVLTGLEAQEKFVAQELQRGYAGFPEEEKKEETGLEELDEESDIEVPVAGLAADDSDDEEDTDVQAFPPIDT